MALVGVKLETLVSQPDALTTSPPSINATFKNSPAISFYLLAFLNSFFFNTSPVALPATYRRADTQTLSKKRHKIECRSSQLDYYALTKNIISNGFVTKTQSSGLHYIIFRCTAIWFSLSIFFVNLTLFM